MVWGDFDPVDALALDACEAKGDGEPPKSMEFSGSAAEPNGVYCAVLALTGGGGAEGGGGGTEGGVALPAFLVTGGGTATGGGGGV